MDPKFRSLCLGLAFVSISAFPSTAFAAANDLFADRVVIPSAGASLTGSNTGATGETGEPSHAGDAGATASAWWKWTAPDNGYAWISTQGSTFDTLLAVYTGSDVDGLTETASNNNAPGGTHSVVAFPCTAGTVYSIAVDGAGAAQGDIALQLSAGQPEIVVEQGGVGINDGAATVVFGTVSAPGFVDRSFTVRNTGSGPLMNVAASVTGAGYSVTVQPAAVIAPGGTSTVTVRFSPTANGAQPGALEIASADADENPFNISLSAAGSVLVLSDSFDPAINAALWAVRDGGTVDTVAQAGGAGTTGNSLRFDGDGTRQAATVALNITSGQLTFGFASGNSGASGWETADTGEEVVVEYSTNGTTWTQFGATYQNPAWQTYSLSIPAAARTPATRFRWRQLSHSGTGFDNWALDDIRIGPPTVAPVINSPLTASAYTGYSFNYQITASNAPDSYAASGLPAGLTINAATGVISGTPTAAGSFSILIQATNIIGTASATLALTVQTAVPAEDFKILSLTANESLVVDHDAITSDDRGGIAVSNTNVLVTGDSNTATYALGTLTGGAAAAGLLDGLCSNLSTGTIYSLANNGALHVSGISSINQLVELNGVTGAQTTNIIALSSPILISGSTGIFSGAGRIAIYSGGRVYDIQLPTGTVIDRGTMPAISMYGSESWASWGVAEQFGGALWLAFRYSAAQEIRRIRVPDGQMETIASFTSLGDMASWTVSPQTGRWYFHYEGGAEFGGSSETLGTARATFEIGTPTSPPEFTNGTSARLYSSLPVRYQVSAMRFPTAFTATGLPPGLTIDTATGLISGMIENADAGSYTVSLTATNAAGTANATLALTVVSPVTGFDDTFDPSRDAALWDSFGGTVTEDEVGQASGAGSTGNSLRFDGTGLRYAVTVPVDTRTGGSISYLLSPGNGSVAGWDAPESGDIVRLDYSTDGGLTWTQVAPLQSWTAGWQEIAYSLPAGARAAAVQFRWMQLSNNGAATDNWALDDVRIGPPTQAPIITSTLAATAYNDLPFTYRILATRGPDSFSADNLPAWLTLNTETGILTGTPPETGNFEVTLLATNLAGTGSAVLTISVFSTLSDLFDPFDPGLNDEIWQSLGGSPEANTVASAAGPGSVDNSLHFNGSGTRFITTNPIDTTAGGMVAFGFASGNGSVTGWDTPESTEGVILEYSINGVNFTTMGGPYISSTWQTISIAIPPAARAGAAQFRWRQLSNSGPFNDNWALDNVIIGQPTEPPVITGSLLVSAYTGVPVSYQIQATNVPISYAATGLPDGLTLDTATGLISGTPTAPGSFAVVITATNGEGPSEEALLVMNIQPLATPETFKILTLGTGSPVITDHDNLTGDDRGGIAVSGSRVFVTGDSATASYTLNNLSGGTSTGRIVDGLFSDLGSGELYTFAYNGVPYSRNAFNINQIIPLNPVTGAVAGAPIPLTQTISSFSGLVCSGIGRVAFYNSTQVYDILLPSGFVIDRGTMTIPNYTISESWAGYGVAEFFDGSLWLAYRDSSNDSMVRRRVPDGLQETIAVFSSLGEVYNWTVSPQLGRWYMHYEGSNQFGGNSETLASASATFSIGASPVPPAITSGLSQTVFTGAVFSYQISATRFPTLFGASGLPPGVAINTATGLISGSVLTEGTWPVTIAATNAAGTTTATLMLRVIAALSSFEDDFDPSRDPLMWAGFGGTAVTDAVGAASGPGTTGNSLRFDGSGSRFALTNPIDTRSGGSVIFKFSAGNDPASTTGWDSLDSSSEHVVLEYSLNGSTFTQIGSPYSNTAWQSYSVPIPAGARTAATRFRWRQLSHSSDNSSDNWAIDDIRIGLPASIPVITSRNTANAYTGLNFRWQITATNYPDTFSATGLPSWLTLDSQTGILSGTPPGQGAWAVNLGATNALGTGSATLTITVSAALSSVALFSDPLYVDTTVGGETANTRTALQNLGFTVNAFTGITDADWAAAFASNSVVVVPDLEVSSILLSTAAVAVIQTELAAGKSLIVTGSAGGSDEGFLNQAGGWSLVSGNATPSGSLSKSSSAVNFASSPALLSPLNGSYLITSASLPPSAQLVYTLGSDTGVFYAGQIGYACYDWYTGDDLTWRTVLGELIAAISAPPVPAILGNNALTVIAGTPVSWQIVASQSPTSYAATGLPTGLSLDPLTGLISGTVLTPGVSSVDVSATNAVGTGSATLTLTVLPAAPDLTVSGPNGAPLVSNASTIAWTGRPGGEFTRTLIVRNNGSLPLTGLGASISILNGTSATFAVTRQLPASLAPGASAEMDITWTPQATGLHSAAASITSNDPDGSFAVSLTGAPDAELPAPLPAQTGVFNGFTRGYWFTAPAAFEITGLRVPTDASSAAQNIAVVRFQAEPPLYATTTSAFTVLHLTRGSTSTSILPVSINVAAGDIIGVLGDRGGVASYAPSGSQTTILSQSVTLRRLGMQDRLATAAPTAIWSENTGSISRVEMFYRNSSIPDLSVGLPGAPSLPSGAGAGVAGAFPGGYRDTEITLHNNGGSDLSAISATLGGAQAGEFSIVTPPAVRIPAGGSTTLVVRYTPASQSAIVQLSIATNDPDENPFTLNLTGTALTAGSGFTTWAAAGGLSGAAALPDASPWQDGLSNLVKYAFNLSASGPDLRLLAPNGTAGLPVITLTGTPGAPVLHVEFLRRTTGDVIYTPERSSTTQPGSWLLFTSTPVVTPAGSGWERVVYDEPAPAGSTARLFGRITVSLP